MYSRPFKQFQVLYRLHLKFCLGATLLIMCLALSPTRLHLGKALPIILVLLHYLLLCVIPHPKELSGWTGRIHTCAMFFLPTNHGGAELCGNRECLQKDWQEAHLNTSSVFFSHTIHMCEALAYTINFFMSCCTCCAYFPSHLKKYYCTFKMYNDV